MIKRFLSFLAPIFTFILLLCSWELIVSFKNIPKYILPAPTDIFSSILLNYEDLLLSTFITFRITLLAFFIASFLAISIAILFSQSKIIELSLYPIAVIFQVTPVVAIAPLILIWVGLDNAEYAILILAVIVAFFPVLANTNLTGHNVGINTYNFTTGPIEVSSFSPTDGSTNQDIATNIVLTFNENITKETTASTKYITIRSGNPSSGTIQQTIDVSTSAVSVSGNQATINPPSDLAYETDTYIVVDEKSFFNSSGVDASGNATINTYNFTTEIDVLGSSQYGGNVICAASSVYWVVAPSSTEVSRDWYQRNHAVTTANSNASCGDWFVPNLSQLLNPGWECRTYWDSASGYYWSTCQHPAP